MTTTDNIDKLGDLIAGEHDLGSVQLLLAKIRLEVQLLISDNAKLRELCGELQRVVHQETVRRNQTAEMLKSQLPAGSVSTQQAATKLPVRIKSRLKKPTASKSTRKNSRGNRQDRR